jgi:transposase
MGKPYSEDLRARVVRAGQDGSTIPEIAEQFGVSISSVVRFRRLHRESGSVSSAKFGGYKRYTLAAHEASPSRISRWPRSGPFWRRRK